MGEFSDWLKGGKNYRKNEGVQYYEDSHEGSYASENHRDSYAPDSRRDSYAPDKRQSDPAMPKYSGNPSREEYLGATPMPTKSHFISPRSYQNVVVYEPRSPEDVQTLIDYLKRREPAVVNLNEVGDAAVSQRILDFISGAIYALNGSVHRISGNIFLLSPEGVEITVPYEPNRP